MPLGKAVPCTRITAAPVQVHVLTTTTRPAVVEDGSGWPDVGAAPQARCTDVPDAAEVDAVSLPIEAHSPRRASLGGEEHPAIVGASSCLGAIIRCCLIIIIVASGRHCVARALAGPSVGGLHRENSILIGIRQLSQTPFTS